MHGISLVTRVIRRGVRDFCTDQGDVHCDIQLPVPAMWFWVCAVGKALSRSKSKSISGNNFEQHHLSWPMPCQGIPPSPLAEAPFQNPRDSPSDAQHCSHR